MFLDRTGHFIARIIDSGVTEGSKDNPNSGSMMANFEFEIEYEWDSQNKQWVEYTPDTRCRGNVCLLKTGSEAMEENITRLAEATGWSGAVEDLQNTNEREGALIGVRVQIEVKSEQYNGKTYYKADRIKHIDAIPGGAGIAKVEDDRLKSLEDRFGGTFRALIKQNGGAPAVPKAPARRVAAPAGAPAGAAYGQASYEEDQLPL